MDKLTPDTQKKLSSARNIQHSDRVVLASEDGDRPVICEGKAAPRDWHSAKVKR